MDALSCSHAVPHEVKLNVVIVKQAVTLAKRGDNKVKFLIVYIIKKVKKFLIYVALFHRFFIVSKVLCNNI